MEELVGFLTHETRHMPTCALARISLDGVSWKEVGRGAGKVGVVRNNPMPCWMTPVRVLACLRTNWLTVILCPEQGLADGGIPIEIESRLIPFDLRMPNSEFFLLMREDTSEIAQVLRIGEEVDGARFSVENEGFI